MFLNFFYTFLKIFTIFLKNRVVFAVRKNISSKNSFLLYGFQTENPERQNKPFGVVLPTKSLFCRFAQNPHKVTSCKRVLIIFLTAHFITTALCATVPYGADGTSYRRKWRMITASFLTVSASATSEQVLSARTVILFSSCNLPAYYTRYGCFCKAAKKTTA